MAPLVLCALHASTFRGTQLGRRPQRVVFARCTARLISGRARLVVQANELNKWADIDGGDEDAGGETDGFDRETAAVVLRVLTARATQQVLIQQQELDLFVAQWLNNWCSSNPPMEGSAFILKLMAERGRPVTDPATGAVHTIDPQVLGHRILTVREAMAKSISESFPKFVSLENTAVMRAHLTKNSYTSGSVEKGQGGTQSRRRGYNTQRRGGGSGGGGGGSGGGGSGNGSSPRR